MEMAGELPHAQLGARIRFSCAVALLIFGRAAISSDRALKM